MWNKQTWLAIPPELPSSHSTPEDITTDYSTQVVPDIIQEKLAHQNADNSEEGVIYKIDDDLKNLVAQYDNGFLNSSFSDIVQDTNISGHVDCDMFNESNENNSWDSLNFMMIEQSTDPSNKSDPVEDLNEVGSITPYKQPHSCQVCGNTYKWRKSLRVHLKKHTVEDLNDVGSITPYKQPHSCQVCGKTYKWINSLRVHLKKHSGESEFNCSFCNASFIHAYRLKIHLYTHTGEKPFTCQWCSKSFPVRHKLLIHSRNHTDEKPHVCEVCKRPFTKKSDLALHYQTHSVEKLHLCHVCGKSYKMKRDLTRHSKIHLLGEPENVWKN